MTNVMTKRETHYRMFGVSINFRRTVYNDEAFVVFVRHTRLFPESWAIVHGGTIVQGVTSVSTSSKCTVKETIRFYDFTDAKARFEQICADLGLKPWRYEQPIVRSDTD